jgi:archaeosine synthase alpha-subunit
MLDVTDRSGPARAGRWLTGPSKVDLPNIMFHSSSVFPAPPYADLTIGGGPRIAISLLGKEELASFEQHIIRPLDVGREEAVVENGNNVVVVRGKPDKSMTERTEELFVLGNAFELRRDARAFVESVASLRNAIGHDRLIYAPGIMEPANLALLAYLGVDLFDSSLPLYQATRGKVLLTEGSLAAEDASWLVNGPEQTQAHNLEAAWRELKLVRHMIKVGRLRELVETRVNASPWMVAALRIFDLEHYDFQEQRTAVVGSPFYCNSKASLFRPDVWRFRRRIMERWEPAPHKKVLLLIPCSAKKPYYTSKSHRAFEEVLLSVPNSCAVQELIITSPLGAVPRELELFYPASQYDIPVTGNWDREEVAMIQQLVKRAASFGFTKVISHLGSESGFVQEVVDCVDTTEGQGTTAGEALERMRSELVSACASVEKAPRAADRVEFLRSQARYQFGKEGNALLDGCTVVGKYPYLKFMRGNSQVGMLTPDRGMLSLTMDGGKVLMEQGIHTVQMGDFDLGGNLFAVGVTGADERIRAGDEVAIVRNGDLEGVGVAAMSGAEMVGSRRGEAVRVRHKRKR